MDFANCIKICGDVNPDHKFEATLKLLEIGDYEAARANFHELASEAQENESKCTYTLGELLALVRLGRTSEARQLLKASRSFLGETDEGQVRADLVEVQIDSVEEKWDHVLPSLERMAQKYKEILCDAQLRDVYEEIQLRRGMRLAFLGKFREAAPILAEVLTFNNSSLISAEFWYELAKCYVDSDDFEKAKDAYSNALDMGLDDIRASHAHWEIAVCLMRKESHARALEELRLAEERATAAKIEKKNIHKAMSVAFFKLGMKDEAMRYATLAGVKH